jgi:hypothetical protein
MIMTAENHWPERKREREREKKIMFFISGPGEGTFMK